MIASVYEKEQLRRLKEKNLVIETFYSRNKDDYHREEDGIFVRSSDGLMDEKITNKTIKEKRYFLNNKCIYRETNFNNDIVFNVDNIDIDDDIIICPNCGHQDNIEKFSNGCPYCKANYNIGINRINRTITTTDKFANNSIVTDQIIHIFILLFYVIGLPISIVGLFYDGTDRIISIIILISGIIYIAYCFKYKKIFKKKIKNKDGTINKVLQEKYDTQLEGYDFKKLPWLIDRDENEFYNSLSNNINSKLFSINKDIIDFDLLKFISLDFISEDEVNIKCIIREVYFNNEIKSLYKNYDILMKYNYINDDSSYKVIKCSGCGASIDVNNKNCKYCGKEINNNTPWSIVDIK